LGCPGISGSGTGKKLPSGSKRFEAIRKAEQLHFAAEMKKWLMPKERNGAPKVTG
jgi:hypothetical protein